jgi:hypothetical protein
MKTTVHLNLDIRPVYRSYIKTIPKIIRPITERQEIRRKFGLASRPLASEETRWRGVTIWKRNTAAPSTIGQRDIMTEAIAEVMSGTIEIIE